MSALFHRIRIPGIVLALVTWVGALGLLLPPCILLKDRDAGVFMYIGERLVHGAVPYRDVWDHKPPLIFFLNALGLGLGHGSMLGIVGLEWIALGLAGVLLALAAGRVWGFGPGLLAATAMLLVTLVIGDFRDMTEEYALTCQALAVFAFVLHGSRPRFGALLLGVAFAALLLLQPNLVAMPASALLLLLFRQRSPREAVVALLPALAGGLTVGLPVLIYLMATGSWGDFLTAVLGYNAAYVRVPHSAFAGLFRTAWQLWPVWLPVAVGVWLIGLVGLLLRRVDEPLAHLALLAFPLEWFCISRTGYDYPHYLITLGPSLGLLWAWAASQLLRRKELAPASNAVIAVAALWLLVLPARQGHYLWMHPERQAPEFRETLAFLAARTAPGDRVLVWGAETLINFQSRRPSPTRFVYQYPLLTKGYASTALTARFLEDLQANKPRYVVDTSGTNELIPPLEPANYRTWFAGLPARWAKAPGMATYGPPPDYERVLDFIRHDYQPIEHVAAWTIYGRRAAAKPERAPCALPSSAEVIRPSPQPRN